jgi:hypothetical protein
MSVGRPWGSERVRVALRHRSAVFLALFYAVVLTGREGATGPGADADPDPVAWLSEHAIQQARLPGDEGGDVDDRAATLPLHHGRDEPGQAHQAQQQQVQPLVPGRVADHQQRALGRVSGVVHHRVDATEPLQRAPGQLLQVGSLGQRAPDADAPELVGELEDGRRAGEDGYPIATPGELARARGSDA